MSGTDSQPAGPGSGSGPGVRTFHPPVRRRRMRPAPGSQVARFHTVLSGDGTSIEVWENTTEGPTVLLCNGLGTNAYSWPALLDGGCGVKVVSWNHRGTGGSERPLDPSRVGVDAFVEDAIAVLDDAGIERCVVAGWSIGVNTAFELAVRHPERVSGLFAVAGVPGGTFSSMGAPLLIPRPARAPLSLATARLLKLTGPALTSLTHRLPVGPVTLNALRFSGLMFPTASYVDVRRAARDFLTTPVDWYMHLALAASRHPRVSLSSIAVPVAFVAGKYDVLASTHDLRSAADRIEGASYLELRGSHFLPLERSGTLTRLLREFVAATDSDRRL